MPTKNEPTQTTTPHQKRRIKNKQDELYLICNSTIVEENENQTGEEAIFCEDICQG